MIFKAVTYKLVVTRPLDQILLVYIFLNHPAHFTVPSLKNLRKCPISAVLLFQHRPTNLQVATPHLRLVQLHSLLLVPAGELVIKVVETMTMTMTIDLLERGQHEVGVSAGPPVPVPGEVDRVDADSLEEVDQLVLGAGEGQAPHPHDVVFLHGHPQI